jgi:CHAT domain-containing protein
VSSIISANLLKGSAATTSALLKQKGPLVLHIATHGYFDGNKRRQALELNQELQVYPRGNFPLLKEEYSLGAGLVLAGANETSDKTNEDGYLTAAQAQNLNLKGTELVVLSACSTGLGREFVGEGLYGLQRSLAVAGARSTLLSLWHVNDEATADFMIRFYTRLKGGESRSEALAAVQKDFRDGKTGNPRWRHPYYWAAWQLVGDWRPIKGL